MGNFPLPAFVTAGAAPLRTIFWESSQHDIDLQLDLSQLNVALKPGVPDYYALDLQIATMQLTHNTLNPAHRAERVAVLFASYYQPNHGVLGVMFDRGKPSAWDDPHPPPITTALAREGCAIFLGAIAQLRGTGVAYQVQTQFTTVHEMGHLFNLQHADVPQFPPNFMATTQSAAPYQPNAFHFLPPHCNQLAACSHSAFVWPGGAPFDGDSGDLPVLRSTRRLRKALPFGLELSICMSKSEFWSFEPVELEVGIAVLPGVSRRFTIPDIVDPGYEAFTIWLEDPRGERRQYRSPRRYCSAPGKRVISEGRPFRRDISIFLDAAGYTFRTPGIWKIWAEFGPGPDKVLVSNRIEVNILPKADTEQYRRAVSYLARPESASLLYHRLIRPGISDAQETLEAHVAAQDAVAKGGVEFVLGRAFLELAARGDERDGLAQAGDELLRRARDHSDLGEHRRSIADALIKKRVSRRRRRKPRHEIPSPPPGYVPWAD